MTGLRTWQPARDKQLINLKRSGMKFEDIGVELGCSRAAAAQRFLAIGGNLKPIPVSHKDSLLANDLRDKWLAFYLAAQKCNNSGMGVKSELGVNHHRLVVWKGPIAVYDPDTMQTILNELT